MRRTIEILCGVLGLVLSVVFSPANAQDNYPSTPIRVVQGFPPGGVIDLVTRLVAQKLAVQMNAAVIVESRDGANGNIGAEYVAKSKPDGYTLLLNSSGVVLSRAFGDKLGYDIFKDLVPVALTATQAQFLVVQPSLPANTPAEFIAYVKANPDKLAYGSAGTGSNTHLLPVLFLQTNGLTALHVPYKGSAAAVLDLAGGRIQFAMHSTPSVLPMIKDKRIKALAITSLKRSPLLPDVPTLSETVMPGFEVGSWNGVLAPANTPSTIVRKLNVEILKAMQDPDMKSRLAQSGVEPLSSTPAEYGAYIKAELERWTKVIKSAGIKPE